MSKIERGAWVQIHRIILTPGERVAAIPEETRAVPFEMRVKGFLIDGALIGDEVMIKTVIGRNLTGTLIEANPKYVHNFGEPVPQLLTIGTELRSILKDGGAGE